MSNKVILVFGSNTAGIHGAGVSKLAHERYGAEYGVGYGVTGNSFAIPTKGHVVHPKLRGENLHLNQIRTFVDGFIKYAELTPENIYQITRIGCGLSGFKDEEIAPLFDFAPSNCGFDLKWKKYLPVNAGFHFWGTL